MVMKILILIFFFEIKESKITRGHNYTLVKKQSRLDVRKFSFSQRTINVWNNLSTDCVHASSVNMFKNKIDKYLVNPFAFTNCVCIGLAVFAFKALEIPCLFAFSGGKTQKCKYYY